MMELYLKDIKVWIPDPVNVWQSATIVEDYKKDNKTLKLITDDGQEKVLSINNPDTDLPHLRNPSILIGQNDLTALSYLHEPDVLHNLEVRFLGKQTIYTYCGIILVAINPYQDMPLYSLDIIRAYRGHNMGELEPHIFAIAEEAFAKLEREKSDISIIVSGESGAGKTMSAKYAMRYFAAVGGNESQTHIERKVLASSPVMESFGNAKTTRNNNSSRFGKFTQLLFTNEMSVMSLTGATMKTYLLEKSRVVFQSVGERNYHIFYQLCASKDDWSELLLDDWDKFHFLNQGAATQIPSDTKDFEETLTSLKTLGFSTDSIRDIMHILAGILHLGNIRFVSNSTRNNSHGEHEDSCNIAVNDLHLSVMCDLLQINKKDLRKWLITRQIDSYNEQVLIPHNKHAAETARDALAKHIYAKIFDYIVKIINENLISDSVQDAFIGVLDIYGFETFEKNSFEQFCINYANEKLQQQFNQHVFKLEQEEYLKEGIVWTMIDFYDNQPCINLIEEKLGVLDLLDEECRMVNGSDETWLTKLYEKCTKYEHFAKPRFGQQSFVIKHFSDTVQYESYGFVEKNRDHVSKELVGVLQMSDMAFCRQLMCLEETKTKKLDDSMSPTSGGQGRVVIKAKYATLSKQPQKKTVGSQFRESLSSLINTLSKTTSHYVRCIKPNEEKAPFKWEPQKIVQQLRACGVLETVRISAAGFPSRWSYERFYERYHLLCKQVDMINLDWNIQKISEKIVLNWIKDEERYRFGKTQIFFRAGQVAYLEQVRSDVRKRSIIIVQAHIRRFIYERKYQRIRKIAIGLQRFGRGWIARQKAQEKRQTRAAITIQRHFRGWIHRNRFLAIRRTILGIQTRARGLLVRRKFNVLLDNYKAIQIQRFCRGYLARQAFNKRKHSIIIVQSLVRRFLARRQLKKLKAEARTITHIQKMYKGLEQKIFELQQRNDVLIKENQGLKIQTREIPELKSKLDAMKSLESELNSTKVILIEKEEKLEILQSALQKEQDEKMDILQEKHKFEEKMQHEQELWLAEKEELCNKLEILQTEREDSPTTKRSKIMLNVDNNEIQNAYQKSVKDKENLENENAALKIEVKRLQYILTHPNELEVYSKSINTSNDDSLDSKRSSNLSDNQLYENHRDKVAHKDATSIILRLRKLLEEEKSKGETLRKEVGRFRDKSNSKITVADIIRLSELEVENEKLKQDYQLLRNSIERNVAILELEAQYQTIVSELARSREECVQLKAILAQQSESLRSLSQIQASIRPDSDRVYDEGELIEAFQAQKLVNKQLESELKALTEEQTAKLVELHKQIDELTSEKTRLHGILHEQLDKVMDESDPNEIEEILRQNNYLRCEVERSALNFIEIQEQMNEIQTKYNEIMKQNKLLLSVIKEHGLNDPTMNQKQDLMQQNNLLAVKKKAQDYQGIFKYRPEDEPKILQRLVHDLTPRIALTLAPGLPAYIIFMCIRYTDLVNADQHVRTLLSQFVLCIKKHSKVQHSLEHRILWFVNAMTLLNLLKQYGGIEDYLAFNTPTQNEQQLKNFDLSEYRSVIYETIINSYGVLIRQIQVHLKKFIVPAILDHDEMSRGLNRNRSVESPSESTEPKSLIKHLDEVYQQLKYFGLDSCYIEQFITQLMQFICAVAMNNLMLRPEICMWKTGMRIRYNVSCLEGWIRTTQLSKDTLNPLLPLNEVAQVLQARKIKDEDIQSLCDLCPHLVAGQVLKIIKSYTPDDCEEPIHPSFIEKLAAKLKERPGILADENFTSDENAIIGLTVVYKQSDVKLEEIEIPSCLQLNGLLTKI